jgi:hypothetical protein
MLALDPPPAYDAPLIANYQRVGLCGLGCNWETLSGKTKQEWRAEFPTLGKFMENSVAVGAAHGWIDYNPPGSQLGTTNQRDYYKRAYDLAAGTGMLGLSREEADYWITLTDAQGRRLIGSKDYVLHLPPSGIPSNAFWSVTLDEVEKDGQFLTPNPIHRYEISSRTPNLHLNQDRSCSPQTMPE